MNAELVINFLRQALDEVGPMYYLSHLKHRGQLDQLRVGHDHPKRRELEIYLTRHGERVFCYELYHQIRILMDAYFRDNPEDNTPDREDGVYLQAELKKQQIANIIEFFGEIERPLEKEYIPDFLLHSPGNFERNELIIEVKSNPELTTSDFRDDLLKIQEFIANYNYRFGVFLSVNTEWHYIASMLNKIKRNRWINRDLPNNNQIFIMCKQSQTSTLYEWTLDQASFRPKPL